MFMNGAFAIRIDLKFNFPIYQSEIKKTFKLFIQINISRQF